MSASSPGTNSSLMTWAICSVSQPRGLPGKTRLRFVLSVFMPWPVERVYDSKATGLPTGRARMVPRSWAGSTRSSTAFITCTVKASSPCDVLKRPRVGPGCAPVMVWMARLSVSPDARVVTGARRCDRLGSAVEGVWSVMRTPLRVRSESCASQGGVEHVTQPVAEEVD